MNIEVNKLIEKLLEIKKDGFSVVSLDFLEEDKEFNFPPSLHIDALECGGRGATDYENIEECPDDIIKDLP